MKKGFLSEKDYNFIFARAPRLCVDLIIKTKQGVLLSKRAIQPYKGTWHLPGGRVYFKESIDNALKRIAKAEIGVPVKIQKLVGFLEFPREVQNKHIRHSVSMAFLVIPLKKNYSGGFQGEKFAFFKTFSKNVLSVHGKFLKINKLLK